MIMGILNVTPDSFSDGSQFNSVQAALKHAESMIKEGVDIIDVGGESTRPGAAEVNQEEEIRRVIPIVREIKKLGIAVSVDTSKTQVMKAAADVGVDMINDVRALSDNGAVEVVAEYQLATCLMHMQGQPNRMQDNPEYQNVVLDVIGFLKKRIGFCIDAGVKPELISIDPGFGFGKNLQHNLMLLQSLKSLECLKVPVLVGLSRKSMIGQITGRDICDRLAGSLALALIAMQQGAKIIRVHDVKQTVDIKKIFLATNQQFIESI